MLLTLRGRSGRAAVLGCCLILASSAAGETLVAASSDDHLWFIVRLAEPKRPVVLRHHARAMEGPYYSQGVPLSRFPVAMAAWDNELWLVFAPKPGQTPPRRETFTVRVEQDPALGGYYHTPHDHLRVVSSLEGLGKLVAFVGTAGGPVALLLPTQRATAGVHAGAASIAAEPVLEGPRLLQLRGQSWVPLSLPRDFTPGRACRLGAGGEGGRTLVLVTESAGRRPRRSVFVRNSDGTWTGTTVGEPARELVSLERVGSSVALVEESPAPGRVEVAYLQPRQRLPLASLATPSGRWAVLGVRDGLRVLEQTGDELTLRRIDPRSGRVSSPRPMSSQPLMTGRLLYRPLLFAAAITALLVVFLFKPGPNRAAVSLPADVASLPLVPRLVAVAVDLALGAAVTFLVLRPDPADLVRFPLWTTDLTQATAVLVMIAVTVGHSTLGELLVGRTLGKALVGARVVSGDGSRPAPVAIVVRNAFKALVLLIPVLAVFALLNPHAQGLGDLIARTVVVRSAAPPAQDR